jgi:hypothetical protein
MLSEACFRKTWYIRQGKNAGMGTCQAPFPNNPELRLWKGKLPLTEAEDLILAIGITLDPRGFLPKIPPAGEPTRRRTRSARNRRGQGRDTGRLKASELTVLLRGSQALQLCEMQKENDTQRQRDKEKKNKNDLTPSLNRAASYLKDRGRTETS